MDERIFRELCLAQALGTLDEKGRQLLFMALETAGEARLGFFADAIASVRNSDGEPQVAGPSPEVRKRILAMADADAPKGNLEVSQPALGLMAWFQNASRPWFSPSGLAFAALAFGAGLWMSGLLHHWELQGSRMNQKRQWDLLTHLNRAPEDVRKDSDPSPQNRIVALEDSLSKQAALLAVLSSQHLQVAELKAQGQERRGFGRVMWDPQQQQGILHVSDLPPAPDGQVYQLWILVDDKRDPCLNAGSFKVRQASLDGETFRFGSLEAMGKTRLLGFEITLERKAGHPHPVGPSLLRTETFL